MAYNKEKKILIREFNEDRDTEVVGKLERNCEIGSKKGVSIFTYMIGHDPLCRIRLYPLHVMLVGVTFSLIYLCQIPNIEIYHI